MHLSTRQDVPTQVLARLDLILKTQKAQLKSQHTVGRHMALSTQRLDTLPLVEQIESDHILTKSLSCA